jgi:hypothetical protein
VDDAAESLAEPEWRHAVDRQGPELGTGLALNAWSRLGDRQKNSRNEPSFRRK